ncbi:hypothetical protein ONZ45_g14999 [Pleurotus djamor]|nr:hypothetical protein ONZ45_g14999 [Pleurotus djamor]
MGNSSSRNSSPSRYKFDAALDRVDRDDGAHRKPLDTDLKVPFDPPPSYTSTITDSTHAGAGESSSSNRSRDYLRAPMRAETAENALQMLRKYDTVLIVDDSGSMLGSKWRQARKALVALANMAGKYDADGIDIAFLNSDTVATGVKNGSEVDALFDALSPFGHTPIGERLEALLLVYLARIEGAQRQGVLSSIKPVNYVVITDGEPTDDPETVIVAAAQRLDKGNFPLTQVGIQLVQIGTDKQAAIFLKELDDGLHATHHIRDIVDTTPFHATGGELTSDLITKVLIGGINRRVDRKGVASIQFN